MNFLTIDIGGTEFKYGYCNENYEYSLKNAVPTFPKNDKEAFEQLVCKLYEEFPDLDGIAVSLPGMIDAEKGICKGSSLGFTDYPIVSELNKKIEVPIRIENDGISATVAEGRIGALKDCKTGVLLTIGTGIGGGIILDGRPFTGKAGKAGNLSFILDRFEDDPYALTGDIASTRFLCQRYAGLKNIDPDDVNGRIVMTQYRKEEKEALEAVHLTCDNLARLIYDLCVILDPDAIAIGGGISSDELFIENIRDALKRLQKQKWIFSATDCDRVLRAKFGNDANMLGVLIEMQDRYF